MTSLQMPSSPLLKVVATDGFDKEAQQLLADHKQIEIRVEKGISQSQVISVLKEADLAVIRSATVLDKEILEKLPNLKGVVRAGVGIDNIDVDVATQLGIYVWNAPTGNYQSTAELAIGLMFSVARKISFATEGARSGRWLKKEIGATGRQLQGSKLGLFGAGNIGLRVAQMASAIGMRVQICDPVFDSEKHPSFEKVSFETLLQTSDVISIHAPILPSTKHKFNLEVFRKMKPSVLFIHAARGGIVKDADLAVALKENLLAGVGLDVFEIEPFPSNDDVYSSLLKDPRVVATPHIGASTLESQRHVGLETAEKILSVQMSLLHPGTLAPRPLNAPSPARWKLQFAGNTL